MSDLLRKMIDSVVAGDKDGAKEVFKEYMTQKVGRMVAEAKKADEDKSDDEKEDKDSDKKDDEDEDDKKDSDKKDSDKKDSDKKDSDKKDSDKKDSDKKDDDEDEDDKDSDKKDDDEDEDDKDSDKKDKDLKESAGGRGLYVVADTDGESVYKITDVPNTLSTSDFAKLVQKGMRSKDLYDAYSDVPYVGTVVPEGKLKEYEVGRNYTLASYCKAMSDWMQEETDN